MKKKIIAWVLGLSILPVFANAGYLCQGTLDSDSGISLKIHRSLGILKDGDAVATLQCTQVETNITCSGFYNNDELSPANAYVDMNSASGRVGAYSTKQTKDVSCVSTPQ
jgi:hypothetical protein